MKSFIIVFLIAISASIICGQTTDSLSIIINTYRGCEYPFMDSVYAVIKTAEISPDSLIYIYDHLDRVEKGFSLGQFHADEKNLMQQVQLRLSYGDSGDCVVEILVDNLYKGKSTGKGIGSRLMGLFPDNTLYCEGDSIPPPKEIINKLKEWSISTR